MIPEAAVEAAAEVLWDKEVSARDVRAALEAAAPHMLAAAWDAGYLVAKEAIRQLDPINPYEDTK